ncbi:hypothetical protein [Devriesea agamarum]|uniref:hypothetical protein n=1 Tax=Devriesea agamarum TaxID=472569 RepID=UPI00071DFE73|nr:hypothetical protein [Devriesea agamarum]
MTDLRLMAFKHGRIMMPLILLMAILSIVRLISDDVIVQQIHGIGVMLLSVGLAVYALDYLIRLIGLSEDRLLLLSPKPRWIIAALSSLVMGILLTIGYIAAIIPQVSADGDELLNQLIMFVSYIVSVFSGLGLMVFVVYLLKGVRGKTALRASTWLLFVVIVGAAMAACILSVIHLTEHSNWSIGVASNNSAVNVYATILPVTVLDVKDIAGLALSFAGANAIAGLIFWVSASLLARRPNNYI